MFYLETWKKFTTSITGGTLISFSDISPLSRSCRELKPKRPLGHALWVENISSSLSQGRISSQRAHRPSSSSVGYAQGKCSQQRVGESYRQAACGQWVSMTIEEQPAPPASPCPSGPAEASPHPVPQVCTFGTSRKAPKAPKSHHLARLVSFPSPFLKKVANQKFLSCLFSPVRAICSQAMP